MRHPRMTRPLDERRRTLRQAALLLFLGAAFVSYFLLPGLLWGEAADPEAEAAGQVGAGPETIHFTEDPPSIRYLWATGDNIHLEGPELVVTFPYEGDTLMVVTSDLDSFVVYRTGHSWTTGGNLPVDAAAAAFAEALGPMLADWCGRADR